MQLSNAHPQILWRQVWGLAALLAAILFSFMAYGLYQPKVLTALGFVELAGWLGIAQGFLGAAIEPLVGSVSDRILRRVGSRLPIISIGVTLAGLIFIV
ncbi:MAG TPA: MFS transporter, partial [Allocoleopsis sp.]